MCLFCSCLSHGTQEFSPTDRVLGKATDPIASVNAQALRVVGTSRNDRLQGTQQGDNLSGRAGNDNLIGRAGNDTLLGGTDRDTLSGGSGNDRLTGGAGRDTLSGNSGRDTFIFQRPDDGVDTIRDFEPGSDRILIKQAGFQIRLAAGELGQNRFRLGRQALRAQERFLYDRSTGSLFFDPDGSGQAPRTKLASLTPGTRLSADDIVLSAPPSNSNANAPNSSQNNSSREFNITVDYRDNNLSQTQRRLFNQAIDRWESIIVGDLPQARLGGEVIDDLKIDVRAPSIDGVGGILGQAGPTRVRSGSLLPYTGVVELDRADLNAAVNNGTFDDLVVHEIGHVLGFGIFWDRLDLIAGQGGNNPRYIGENAVREYRNLVNPSANAVPLENRGPVGTRDSHWRESSFGNELMTGILGRGNNPLSRITIGAFEDLGYRVNYATADPFG
ncbi:MAG: leishmanolysin-related zinc metalloendopeptidase [Cyanobacteria bacterium P01_F01_bin.42]